MTNFDHAAFDKKVADYNHEKGIPTLWMEAHEKLGLRDGFEIVSYEEATTYFEKDRIGEYKFREIVVNRNAVRLAEKLKERNTEMERLDMLLYLHNIREGYHNMHYQAGKGMRRDTSGNTEYELYADVAGKTASILIHEIEKALDKA